MNANLHSLLWAEVEVSWHELATALGLRIPQNFPLPLPEAECVFRIWVEAALDESVSSQLRIETEYDINPAENSFYGFTLGQTAKLSFLGSASSTEKIDGALTIEVQVKLRQLPELEQIQVRSGDAEGWTTVKITAKAEKSAASNPGDLTGGRDAGFEFAIKIIGVVKADFFLPGLPSATPPLELTLDSIGGALFFNPTKQKFSGHVDANGTFEFRPQLDESEIPVVEYLKPVIDLLRADGSVNFRLSLSRDEDAHRDALLPPETSDSEEPIREIGMTILASILLAEGNPEVCVSCMFKAPDLYPFGVLRQLVQMPRRLDEQQKQIGPAFALNGIYFCLSRDPIFAIEMQMKAGVEVPAYFKISTKELSVGIGRILPGSTGGAMTIPLQLPQISRTDFGFVKDVAIHESRDLPDAHPLDRMIYDRLSEDGKSNYDRLMQIYFDTVEQLSGAARGKDQLLNAYKKSDGKWQVEPPAKPHDSEFQFKQHLAMGLVGFGPRKPDGSFETTGELAIVGRADENDENNWQVLMAKPALRFDNFSFTMSLRNPRNIGVNGKVRFITEGWFEEIRKIALAVSLGPDLISFSLDVAEQTKIKIPEFLPGYKGGSISIGKLEFGFGYLKRSLAIAFAGELELPEKLVDDLDTSGVLGAGVRLPIKSRLAFQFDLMPFVIKEVVIVIPLFQFNWDLRRGPSAGIADSHTCEPSWDGLQLIIPDVVRCSLKRISYSPIVLCYCSSNSDFDGDLMLGGSQNGLTIVADNVYWDYGIDCGAALVMAPVTWPPFVDNFCVNLRLAGFGMHFNFQRPIPTFSPLALFEMLALMADPLYEISPRGELADTVRVTLEDAYVVLPEPVRRLLPQAEALLPKPINVTINIATFLTLLQRVAKAIKPVGKAMIAAVRNGEQLARALTSVPALNPSDIRTIVRDSLNLLPPELRKLRLSATLGGFDASIVLLLTDVAGIIRALEGPERSDLSKVPESERWQHETRTPQARDVPRMFNATHHNLMEGAEFADFTLADFNQLAAPPSGVFLTSDEITPAFVTTLKTDNRLIARSLKRRFSSGLFNMLDEYRGGALPNALRSRLLNELNSLFIGEGTSRGTIFDPATFGQLTLNAQTWELLSQYRAEGLGQEDLRRLNRMLLEAAYPDELPPRTGIVIGARVRVSGSQRFRFVGNVFSDGAFSLITAPNIEPLDLTIAGIPTPLPFAVDGRMQLSGRAKRSGVVGSIRAEGSARWEVIPRVLLVEIGSPPPPPNEEKTAAITHERPLEMIFVAQEYVAVSDYYRSPAQLELFSDGTFCFTADALLTFFENPECKLRASVDMSSSHCLVSGAFDLRIGKVGREWLFDLEAAATGRIGPGPRFSISFDAQLKDGWTNKFFGIPLASVKGTLTESGIAMEAKISKDEAHSFAWPGPGSFTPKLELTNASLSGWTALRKSDTPDFALEGDISLSFFADRSLTIQGRGGISSLNNHLAAFVDGKLTWQGHDWLGGRVEIEGSKLIVSGQCDFAFDLIPSHLPADLSVSGLFFKLSIGGSFTLDQSGNLKAYNLKLDWVLAARLLENQILPLASQSRSVHGDAVFDLPLLANAAFKLVPIESLVLPVPDITQGDEIKVTPYTFGFRSRIISFGIDVPIIQQGSQFLPLPAPPSEKDPNWHWHRYITIPTLSVAKDAKHVPLKLEIKGLSHLSVSLRWIGNGLSLVFGDGDPIPLHAAYPNIS